jgi:predicted enzyme related to lactoylglutathione lyase
MSARSGRPVGGFGGLDAITIDCLDPLALARFWAAVFGTEIESAVGDGPAYVDLLPVPGVPILRFQRVPEPKVVKNRVHLDVAVADLDAACARVEGLGGRRISANAFAEYSYRWLVMADPEDNEFCLVIRESG